MNTSLKYFVGLILLLVFGILATVYFNAKSAAPTRVNQTPTYTDFNVFLPGNNGTNVTVDNFLTDSSVEMDKQNEGLYTLGNTFPDESNVSNQPAYVISYEKDSGYFNITLLDKPLSASRLAAESYLKNLLKLDNQSLCNLSYMVAVPGYVDEAASGIDYRFSFCPGSIQL